MMSLAFVTKKEKNVVAQNMLVSVYNTEVNTFIDEEDIKSSKWGGMTNPDKALEQIVELANKIYYEEEWISEQQRIERDNNIIRDNDNQNKR